jgi:CheY-like chemotaxis protein
MNGLLGMLDLVLDGSLKPDQKEQLETAQRCAYSLLALLNDILDLSKIEAGKMALEKIPMNARTVVEDCVKSQAAKASQKGIDLRFEKDAATICDVMGDPLRLRQIVANLVSNALKFTDSGWVRVRLSSTVRSDGRLDMQVQVRDTGLGIAADKLPAIFEKFTQADGSITRRYGGSGLGLTITRGLVEMHGGDIRVESEPGVGSTFTVMLPCEPAPAPPAATQQPQRREKVEPARLSRARLLLVEDNLVNQKVVLAILRKKGYRIDVANDGREAISALEARDADYDLVLMDVQMPVMDGPTAVRRIREREAATGRARTPIVALSANAMSHQIAEYLAGGMDGHVAKPIEAAKLFAALELAVEGQAARSDAA